MLQQLAHQGVGTLIPVDDQVVDETNLGRLVGATEADVDTTQKVDLALRVATGIDSSINVVRVPERFPSSAAIDALKDADIVVACLDRFDAREGINAFCRRYLIPLVDVGMAIVSAEEHLAKADGQVIASLPGRPCLRCWFLTDPLLARERRERPPGTAIASLTAAKVQNVSLFIKDIGDAALLCFSHFPDILLWHNALDETLRGLQGDCIRFRTCVHVGEVHLSGTNPLALAISQLFKMEKEVPADAVALTDSALHVAWPTVESPEELFFAKGAVEIPGFSEPVPIFTVNLARLARDSGRTHRA